MNGTSGNWFSKLFKKASPPEPSQVPGVAPKRTLEQDFQPAAPYKKGDFIGQKYEIYDVLGKGGFGVVYLAYSHETGNVYALKTFLDEFLADAEVRMRFQKEASVWIELGSHPFLVRADYVDEMSGRLYILLEYIAPNDEGLNTLEGYLQRRPPDLAQSLRWAIQVCYGMEYAYSKGVRAHRDLKPANIMIGQDKTARISDFGLAGVLNEFPAGGADRLGAPGGRPGQTVLGAGFGTPAYMPPEQFDNAARCDERSDIYSFGIVLYQMASGGKIPFPVPRDADWQKMQKLHRESPLPRLDSPLFPIIQRCLEKLPGKRYRTFEEVRKDLEPLLKYRTGEVIGLPQLKDLKAWEWSNKGLSLDSLGRYADAIQCFDNALKFDPRQVNAWNNKGNCLDHLGRYAEALVCLDKALELDPRNVNAWSNKGNCHSNQTHYEDAIRFYDKALELDPRNVNAWGNKAASLNNLGRPEEAICCLDKALELDPRNVVAWSNKGASLNILGRQAEAILCYNRALGFDPHHATAWKNKGITEDELGLLSEAARSYQQFLAVASAEYAGQIEWINKRLLELIRPVQNPDPLRQQPIGEGIAPSQPKQLDADYWNNKGIRLDDQGRYEEAIRCYDKALTLDKGYKYAWNNKGNSLYRLGRCEEAIRCFDKALELDGGYVMALSNRGNSLNSLGRYAEAIQSLDRALELQPNDVAAWINKGNSLNRISCYAEAIRCYDRALEFDPLNKFAWKNKGSSLYNLTRCEEAIHCYDQALELDLRSKDVWFNKGNILGSLGRQEEAIRCYDQALELDLRSKDVWFNKGNILGSLGRHAEAIHCYDQALELDTRFASAWNNKGNSLHDLGRYEDAILCFDKALEIDPREEFAWNNKGNNLNNLGRYEDAILCLDKALEINPRYVDPWFNKGNSFRKLGRCQEAIRCFDQALEIDPRYIGAWCNKALSADELGLLSEAVRSYQQFLAFATTRYASQIQYARKRLRELEGK